MATELSNLELDQPPYGLVGPGDLDIGKDPTGTSNERNVQAGYQLPIRVSAGISLISRGATTRESTMGDAHGSFQDRPTSAARVKLRTPSLRRQASGENMSSLQVVNLSPRHERQTLRDTPHDDLLDSPVSTPREATHATSNSPYSGEPMSPIASPVPPSVFDIAEEPQDEQCTEPTTAFGSGLEADEQDSYNLKPPPPTNPQTGLESLTARLYSVDHLDLILRDYGLTHRLKRFLRQYRPQHIDSLKEYAESRKAIAAVHYANAIANQIQTPSGHPLYVAATLDERFETRSRQRGEELVEEALPAYLTHRLVALVTDTLVKEITGNSAPVIRELIPSLAEVYCITDPSLPDNPIVYASEEFYNITQYGREYVIGRNCRFLQGPKSSPASVRRLVEALKKGEETCETILNYRRDGTPFINLLMLAPMYDNKGTVRYYLGAQIDVSSLIENGRGLESFAQLLSQDRSEGRFGGPWDHDLKQALTDLGQLLTEDEAEIVKDRTQRFNAMPQGSTPGSIRSTASTRYPANRGRGSRVILGMDDELRDPPMWPSASLGPSGRLPGVYQNYLLVRPYPSLRITFTSPALRIPGLLQAKLLDRIGGPSTVREGLLDALSRGTGVTAKVSWLTSGAGTEGGRPRWIHCTPLLGSDDRVGVWMVVMVENEQVTGSLNRHTPAGSGMSAPVKPQGAQGYSSSKLYADYLKREGRPNTQETQQTNASAEERKAVDDHFRNF